MARGSLAVLCLAAALAAAGCRQADGPPPVATADSLERTGDLARDLLNVAGRAGPDAAGELRDDVARFAEDRGPAGVAAAGALSAAVAAAIDGVALTDTQAALLADDLWMAVAGREYSARQVAALQAGIERRLVSAGVGAGPARDVAARVGEVQAEVGGRVRRWYEVF